MCVVDNHVVCGDRQVNAELVAGQAALGLRGQRRHLHTGNRKQTLGVLSGCVIKLLKQTLIFE